MTRLLELEQMLRELATEGRAHWAKEERRFELIDQFIDPQLNLEGLLKQMVDALERHRRTVAALEQEVRRLSGAIELAISDPGATREVNGERERIRLRGFEG
jgi:hypothetical protein